MTATGELSSKAIKCSLDEESNRNHRILIYIHIKTACTRNPGMIQKLEILKKEKSLPQGPGNFPCTRLICFRNSLASGYAFSHKPQAKCLPSCRLR